MATDVTIGGDGTLFIGEDKTLILEVLDTNDAAIIAAGGGNPLDISTWTILFDVRSKDNSAEPALISKQASAVGAYNSVRATNDQRAVVVLTDDDLSADVFKGSNLPSGAKTYRHSWKRMDADVETVLARGDFPPEKATAP